LAPKGAVGTVVVEALPLLEALVEDLGIVDDDASETSVELFGVDAVGAFAACLSSSCSVTRSPKFVGDPMV
jgi:hypothetical protein